MSSAPTTAQGVPPRPCPGCGAKMAVGSLVCTRCGYDLRTGRRWDTALGRPPPKQRARAFWEALRFLAQVGAVLLVAVLIGVVLLFAAHLILLTAYPATPHPDAKAAPAGPAGSAGSNPTNTLPSPLLYAERYRYHAETYRPPATNTAVTLELVDGGALSGVFAGISNDMVYVTVGTSTVGMPLSRLAPRAAATLDRDAYADRRARDDVRRTQAKAGGGDARIADAGFPRAVIDAFVQGAGSSGDMAYAGANADREKAAARKGVGALAAAMGCAADLGAIADQANAVYANPALLEAARSYAPRVEIAGFLYGRNAVGAPQIVIVAVARCEACDGGGEVAPARGKKILGSRAPCPACNGRGAFRIALPFERGVRLCGACKGSGHGSGDGAARPTRTNLTSQTCRVCGGRGYVRLPASEVRVASPPGPPPPEPPGLLALADRGWHAILRAL